VAFETRVRHSQGLWPAEQGKDGESDKGSGKEIAQAKMKDLNTIDVEAAMKIVEGTARSMGIDVVEK